MGSKQERRCQRARNELLDICPSHVNPNMKPVTFTRKFLVGEKDQMSMREENQMSTKMDYDVLVVGVGPVGLILATEL